MTSAGKCSPVRRDDAVGDHPLDPGPDQLHIRSLERPQPGAVVLQDALARGGIVRHDLLQQGRVVADDRPHGGHQSHRPLGVEGVDRLVRGVFVLGVDPVRLHTGCDTGEGHDEPVPPPVEGQVSQRPGVPVGHGRVVQPIGKDPLRGALEDRQVFDVVCDRRADLEPAGPGAHQSEPGPLQVQVVRPARRMEGRSGEGVHARDLGQPRQIERAHGADDEARPQLALGASRVAQAYPPHRRSSCHANSVTPVSKRQCGDRSYLSTIAPK